MNQITGLSPNFKKFLRITRYLSLVCLIVSVGLLMRYYFLVDTSIAEPLIYKDAYKISTGKTGNFNGHYLTMCVGHELKNSGVSNYYESYLHANGWEVVPSILANNTWQITCDECKPQEYFKGAEFVNHSKELKLYLLLFDTFSGEPGKEIFCVDPDKKHTPEILINIFPLNEEFSQNVFFALLGSSVIFLITSTIEIIYYLKSNLQWRKD